MAIEDPNALERVLTQRAREKAVAQSRARSIAQAIDAEGRVRVWDFASRTYQRLWPIDAAEQVTNGTAALDAPAPVEPEPEPPVPETSGGKTQSSPPGQTEPSAAPEPTADPTRSTKRKAKPSGVVANEPEPQDSPEPTQ